MAIDKVILVTGDVLEFEQAVNTNYTSGWAQYRDSNNNSIVDVPKENIAMEIYQDSEVTVSKQRGHNS